MRRLAMPAAVLAACLLAFTACTDEPKADVLPAPDVPPKTSVDVDTPDLRAIKAEAGIADCAPGPGGGGLPAVTLACLGGGTPVDLSSLRGPLVINFWQNQCAACEHEMPILQAFHEQHGTEVAVLGIDSTDVFPGTALEQLRDRGVTYPQLADPDGTLQETTAFAKVQGYPHLIFVDDEGRITYDKSGAVASADELESLVAEHLGVDL